METTLTGPGAAFKTASRSAAGALLSKGKG
jgi:hypothetical protein